MSGVLALPTVLLALAPLHSSVQPLPQPVQKQLKAEGFWRRGCPVAATMPSSEMYPSESAPIDARISSTPSPVAMSSARVAKSMP